MLLSSILFQETTVSFAHNGHCFTYNNFVSLDWRFGLVDG